MLEAAVASTRIQLVEGDIAEQDVDAVVNAAHPDLLGGQGVDGAIHLRGGPQLLAECRRIRGCPIGHAVITCGGQLPARFVIHAVGPYYDPYGDESPLLASAYRNSLRIAAAYGLASVAFPAISAGAFCFPMDRVAAVALRTVTAFLRDEAHRLELVRFVLYPRENERALTTFAAALHAEITGAHAAS